MVLHGADRAEISSLDQHADRVDAEFTEFVAAQTAKAGVVVDGMVCGPGSPAAPQSTQPPLRLSASYVIGCDGANSTVRRLEGMTQTDLGFKEDWLIIDLVGGSRDAADDSSSATATFRRWCSVSVLRRSATPTARRPASWPVRAASAWSSCASLASRGRRCSATTRCGSCSSRTDSRATTSTWSARSSTRSTPGGATSSTGAGSRSPGTLCTSCRRSSGRA